MKKVMFTLCFMFGGIVAVSAQETQDTTSNEYRTETQSQYPQDAQAQDRERIQSTELPDEVKRSLEAQEYRGWLISGAFKAKGVSDKTDTTSTETDANRQGDNDAVGAQAEEVYIVELKNGAETKTVRFDKDGQKIEGMEEDGQENQNEQTEQPAPADQAAPVDPNSNPQQSTESQNDQSSETQTEQSPETQSDKSTETQPDQSKANKPE